ncbi:MAG: ribosome-associated translation inhibitor RaiA [Chitinophagales bacterium]|nr:ribosome-associated translation inhibitor RaiA [Chitinophagales bacterium]
MNIQFHPSGFSASSQLKEVVEKKLEKLETFFDKIIDADVYLKLESHQTVKDKTAEIKLNVPGDTLFSSETAKTFEIAADEAVESLRRQLKKYKEKMQQTS